MIDTIVPNWPAPLTVKACTTLRTTEEPQADLKHGYLTHQLQLPNEPIWLKQVHGRSVVPAIAANRWCEADASFTTEQGQVCVIETADCLPILICNRAGTEIAAIHAGWRGLAHGIIETTICHHLSSSPASLMAWLGPCISAKHYLVRSDVRDAFIKIDLQAEHAFTYVSEDQWQASLQQLARQQLYRLGVHHIYGENFCTFADNIRFYSYRRDQKLAGRLATLIWLMPTNYKEKQR